jgi:phenylalanyl-tRNA synthetase alpha chain
MDIVISRDEERKLLEKLKQRTDTEASRMMRYLQLPDLSRTPGSPICKLVERIKDVPTQKNFDIINIPEVVPASVSFDLFNFAPDHPNRSKSDTYYVDDENILRTHDTVFWYYYLNLPEIKARIANHESMGALCHGKVYRKDEIDRHHMNVFHQMGGWYIQPDEKGVLKLDDLKNVLSEIVKTAFGQDTIYRFNEDVFPYTDPSLEVEIQIDGEWVEVLGGGMPKKEVLANMGVTGYNGWAYGFGLERLAIISMNLPDIRLLWSDDERVKKQLVLGKPFIEPSKYPPIVRDISFIVNKNFVPNNYFDLVRDIAGDFVESVGLIDKYENEVKFGKDKLSYAYRVTYRSVDRTLTNEEIDKFHKHLEEETMSVFGAVVR